jgi:hypothetical protein
MGLFNRKKQPEVVIDLRAPEANKPRWGSPVPCPECGGRGYLDHIDPFRDVMFMHCTQCFNKYELARADMELDPTAEEAFKV